MSPPGVQRNAGRHFLPFKQNIVDEQIKWPEKDGLIKWIESEKDYLQTKAFRTHHLNAVRNGKIETLQRVIDQIQQQNAADHADNLAALNRAPTND